jgi:hypothetical protein
VTPQDDLKRQPVLDEQGLAWVRRLVWAACVAVYLVVFIGSVQAGASDLVALGRAMGFTLGTAVLGRIAMGLLSRATQPLDQGPTASQDGTVGSRVDLVSSPNTPPQDGVAAA